MKWRRPSTVVAAVVMAGATVFAAPAAAQQPSDTGAPAKLQLGRTAARPAQIAGKASSPTVAGESDCATVRANLKAYARQGRKTVSCVTVTDGAAKPPAGRAKARVAAVWCQELGGTTWWIRRNGACLAFKTIDFILIRLPDETVVGTAKVLMSQQINLFNNATEFSEHVEATMTEATGMVNGLLVSFTGACANPCVALGGGRAYGPIPLPIIPGQTLFGTIHYSTQPDPAGIPVTTTTSYDLVLLMVGATPLDPPIHWNGPNPIRCDAQVGSVGGCVIPDYTPGLDLYLSVHRESAAMILFGQYDLPDRWGAGWLGGPPVHRMADPDTQRRNRERICDSSFVRLPDDIVPGGDSCDEFSFAATYESGGMFDLRGPDCAEVRPFQDPADGGWYVERYRFTGSERCIRGHVPLAANTLVGTELSNFTVRNRVLDGDAYWVDVWG